MHLRLPKPSPCEAPTSLQVASSTLFFFFFWTNHTALLFFYFFFSPPILFCVCICSVLVFKTIQPSQSRFDHTTSCDTPPHFSPRPLHHILRLSSLDFTFSVLTSFVVYFSLLSFLFFATHSSMNLIFFLFYHDLSTFSEMLRN